MNQHKMLQLNKYLLSPEKIAAIPSDDRALMIWCGHIHNELMTLLGLYRAIANTSISCAVEREANTTQQLTVVKLIAGKLWEANELLNKGFFGNGLSKIYESILDPDTQKSLDTLKQYFSRKTSLYTLRHNYSFHYTFDVLTTLPDQWDRVPDELTFCAGRFPAHSLFFVSEVMVNKAMFMQLGAGNFAEGVQLFWDDIRNINDALIAVCGTLFTLVVHKYIGKGPPEIDMAVIGVLNPPSIDEPAMPFFVMP